jgi:hypothetical protein
VDLLGDVIARSRAISRDSDKDESLLTRDAMVTVYLDRT